MALEISPIDTFNQIKDLNQMLQRKMKGQKVGKEEKKEKVFTMDEEIDLRALILDNTNDKDLSKITDVIKVCSDRGFDKDDIVSTINKMINEKVIESLENRFIIQSDHSD